MKILFLLSIFILVFLEYGCQSSSNDTAIEDSSTTYNLAFKFEAQDIYKELVKRNKSFTDSILSISNDTFPSANSYDFKNNENLFTIRDTILKPLESDTILPSGVQEQLKEYSNQDLLNAYNAIIKARQNTKGIYGEDNRLQVNSNLQDNYLDASKTVFALIHKKYFQQNGNSFIVKSRGSYAQVYKLCETESFSTENVYANCTAFAISPFNVASAGHCISINNFRAYLLVADFTIDSLQYFNTHGGIPAEKVFEIKNVLESKVMANKIDYSVFTVNKQIPNERIAKLSNNSNYNSNDYFYVIGFPCGLSMKLCNSASFRENNNPYFFQISSDTYGGNSGSPVFNEKTNEVEGILVRGNQDFYSNNNGCTVSIRCPEFGCRGEDITKIQLIKKWAK